MNHETRQKAINITIYFLMLILITLFALWLESLYKETAWQQAGFVNFSLGVVMLAAYISAQTLKLFHLPLLSGYIFAGILAGPYLIGFLTETMVRDMKLLDDLALSFIALAAGGTFEMESFFKCRKAILLNVTFHTLIIFGMIFLFVIFIGKYFSFTQSLSSVQMIAVAILLGVISIARSPSSAIAIISECRARGRLTDIVLGVTIAIDVLIIIFFTLAMAVAKIIVVPGGGSNPMAFVALFLEITASIIIGMISGKLISFYIERAGHDLPLFLLFFGFGITKISFWLSHFMNSHFHISMHLEPLIICMSAGFAVQNFSNSGVRFMESLGQISLPIFVLFFSLAGASLDMNALRMTLPLALCIVVVRAFGIFTGTWIAGTLSKEPPLHNRIGWMAYLTQAGVSIGLAQLANNQFPEIGIYLNTVVLAVITVNQIIGPITFKIALNMAGESGRY